MLNAQGETVSSVFVAWHGMECVAVHRYLGCLVGLVVFESNGFVNFCI